jgi:hypothetical protein
MHALAYRSDMNGEEDFLVGKNIDNLLGLSVSCEILDLFIAVRAGLSQLEQGGQWC